jgi:hypothetical protein
MQLNLCIIANALIVPKDNAKQQTEIHSTRG